MGFGASAVGAERRQVCQRFLTYTAVLTVDKLIESTFHTTHKLAPALATKADGERSSHAAALAHSDAHQPGGPGSVGPPAVLESCSLRGNRGRSGRAMGQTAPNTSATRVAVISEKPQMLGVRGLA